MTTKYGHIYTKNNSGSVDKFVPILNSTDIKHGDEDNVGEILDKSAKSVETEIESTTETIQGPINELIDLGGIGNNNGIIINGNQWYYNIYKSTYEGLVELYTNELFTSSTFEIPTNSYTGISISFSFFDINGDSNIYFVTGNISGLVSQSPYASDSLGSNPYTISISELPSVGQSKDFYPTLIGVYYSDTSNEEEYTGTDIVFTIANIDGTNYRVSFIWNKIGPITKNKKSLKTTVTANDDTETEETNEISGLLQNSNITFEQKLVNAQLYDLNAQIELYPGIA